MQEFLLCLAPDVGVSSLGSLSDYSLGRVKVLHVMVTRYITLNLN